MRRRGGVHKAGRGKSAPENQISHHPTRVKPTDHIVTRPSVEENAAVMRGYSWKLSIAALALLYPVASMFSRLVNFVGLKAENDPSAVDQLQILRLGNLAFIGLAIFGWLIAFSAGLESTRGDDEVELRVGRFTFMLVLIATAVYVVALNIPRI